MPYHSLSWNRLGTLLRIYSFFLRINWLYWVISSTEMYLGFTHRNVRKIKLMIQSHLKNVEAQLCLLSSLQAHRGTQTVHRNESNEEKWHVQMPWGKDNSSNSLQKNRRPFWGWVNGKQGQKWHSFINYKVSQHFSHALCTDCAKMQWNSESSSFATLQPGEKEFHLSNAHNNLPCIPAHCIYT